MTTVIVNTLLMQLFCIHSNSNCFRRTKYDINVGTHDYKAERTSDRIRKHNTKGNKKYSAFCSWTMMLMHCHHDIHMYIGRKIYWCMHMETEVGPDARDVPTHPSWIVVWKQTMDIHRSGCAGLMHFKLKLLLSKPPPQKKKSRYKTNQDKIIPTNSMNGRIHRKLDTIYAYKEEADCNICIN